VKGKPNWEGAKGVDCGMPRIWGGARGEKGGESVRQESRDDWKIKGF